MINVKQLEEIQRKASERAIKIHEALDLPHITMRDGKVVEVLHDEIVRVIDDDPLGRQRQSGRINDQ